MKYHIELTSEQMRVLERCSELFMRLGIGQTWDLADMLCEEKLKDYDKDKPESKVIFERYITKRNAVREVLDSAMRIAYSPYPSPKFKTEDGMIAECIWDAIRCARGTSSYGIPMKIGSEPIPKIEVQDDLIEAINNAPTVEAEKTHWIPCSERLPDVGAILISDGNQVFIGAYYGNNTWSADGCDYDPILEDIAWMPLPDPYGGDKE